MSNVFKNPLVLSETVVGSLIDTRALVLYEQPTDIDFSSPAETTVDDNGDIIETNLLKLIDKRKLKEIFTGFKVPYVSKINGMNIYGISYMSGNVDITSDLCDHPIESGGIITDNAIIQPITIKIQVALPTAFYTRIYKEMIKYFQEKKYILVQTKLAMYRNMVIESMPYKVENETIDRPVIELTLRQIQEVHAQYITTDTIVVNPKEPADANTKDLGRKTGTEVDEVFGV